MFTFIHYLGFDTKYNRKKHHHSDQFSSSNFIWWFGSEIASYQHDPGFSISVVSEKDKVATSHPHG